jgi:hypothetical protein
MEEKIVYFEEFGAANTDTTLALAMERAKARGINKIVLASTRGDTAKTFAEKLKGTGIKMVVVPHQYGFGPDGRQRFPKELVAELEKQGPTVYFGRLSPSPGIRRNEYVALWTPSMIVIEGVFAE